MSDPQMVVLHLPTGHVLAAVAAGPLKPTVDDLTGGTALPVRLPGGEQVAITGDLLTATAAARDLDVLTRPTSFRIGDGVPPITVAGAMEDLYTSAHVVKKVGDQGDDCTSFWQAGDQLEVVKETLGLTGQPAAPAPPGATQRLVACKDSPLYYET
jgi:hypothetical protein